ncbi:MAG: hypothetical protein A2469_02570 [Candidatus Magasanikbacteria bacterium RIFOXYC2_FULL_40_16]|uniref:Uncharacterized protein n=2 Tax=Candidatus Magasanikiibacteriota TaxID=1752731 RepID=A0A1F6P2R1_9BACT|nr:MAG: hypothetical protein A2224_02040 [Candidatus Magasanikbacteria bacterium RIFOXYA2_FULL_40_20]OGH87346.1 MAG: hypothetical protein A2206_02735 [Candidatus Magasanikbacteria bacterium RIFOXYA1_FULL_40_8]OGH90370.1 MAG: hypothetical protein A2469_02570 [Candidatus Magasanikbacteria bacterium RIFOXYC2_FULL_40_16]
MTNNTITLSDPATMLKRLCAVSNDGQLVHGFYPVFLEHGYSSKDPLGIVALFNKAIWLFFIRSRVSPEVIHQVFQKRDEFVDALVPDESSAAETKSLLVKALQY